MSISITGFRNGQPWPPAGTTVDLPDHEARDLIVAGYAKEAADASSTPSDAASGDGRRDAPAADAAGASEAGVDAGDQGGFAGLEQLDKPQLIALAAKRGIEVSSRWGVARLREAITEALGG